MCQLGNVELAAVESLPLDILYHKRFGHRSMDMLKFMASRDEYVKRGFGLSTSAIADQYCKCSVCVQAKMKSTQIRSLVDKSRCGMSTYPDHSSRV